VINTQRMLCANQQMNVQAFPFFAEDLVMLDWSPWNHTAGSNQVFNMALFNGGTLYIDDGKPTPAEFAKSLAQPARRLADRLLQRPARV